MFRIFIIHFCLCSFMTGVIWLVQLVHYPSFMYIDEDKFKQFSLFHQRNISFIVMPAMILELATAAYLLSFDLSPWLISNLAMNVAIFFSTFYLSVPLHQKLNDGFNQETIQKLVKTNWPRTLLWTIRTIILFIYCRTLI